MRLHRLFDAQRHTHAPTCPSAELLNERPLYPRTHWPTTSSQDRTCLHVCDRQALGVQILELGVGLYRPATKQDARRQANYIVV